MITEAATARESHIIKPVNITIFGNKLDTFIYSPYTPFNSPNSPERTDDRLERSRDKTTHDSRNITDLQKNRRKELKTVINSLAVEYAKDTYSLNNLKNMVDTLLLKEKNLSRQYTTDGLTPYTYDSHILLEELGLPTYSSKHRVCYDLTGTLFEMLSLISGVQVEIIRTIVNLNNNGNQINYPEKSREILGSYRKDIDVERLFIGRASASIDYFIEELRYQVSNKNFNLHSTDIYRLGAEYPGVNQHFLSLLRAASQFVLTEIARAIWELKLEWRAPAKYTESLLSWGPGKILFQNETNHAFPSFNLMYGSIQVMTIKPIYLGDSIEQDVRSLVEPAAAIYYN